MLQQGEMMKEDVGKVPKMVIWCVQLTVMCIEFAVMTLSQCRRSHFHVNIRSPRASARPGSGYYLFAKLIARPSWRLLFFFIIDFPGTC